MALASLAAKSQLLHLSKPVPSTLSSMRDLSRGKHQRKGVRRRNRKSPCDSKMRAYPQVAALEKSRKRWKCSCGAHQSS